MTDVLPPADTISRDPRTEYQDRLAARRLEVAAARSRESRLARLRLATFALGALAIWLLSGRLPLLLLIAVPGIAFVTLIIAHDRTRRRLAHAERCLAFYERALARLEGRFAGMGYPGLEWLDDRHPYSAHLDVFGEGSLYELLCGARTAAGRDTLARWLLEPAPPGEIRARQGAVAELRDRIDLREDLATLDDDIVDALGADELVAWATAPSTLVPAPLLRPAAIALALGTAAAALGAAWIGSPPLAWLLVVELGVWWRVRRRVVGVIEAVERPACSLRLIQAALVRVERERFETERLCRIDEALGAHTPSASERLATLLRRVDALEWRENQFFLPIASALLWGTNWAIAIERWRLEHGREIEGWIAAVGDLEALLDLATLAYERPDYAMPRIVEGKPLLDARAVAHPLLLDCTPNDVALDENLSLIVVTGSNMSGKSTLLRTIGVNTVLAQAGAPVRAAALEMSPLAIGASIRTLDSLLDGASRFYAEIRAIKRAMAGAVSRPPGLFLLDELLHGTNSEDRRIGAGAIVRAFLGHGAIGIVTTHDLALAAIADDLAPRARNAHFEFVLEDAEIVFDYTLHAGAVRAGNALAIMRAAGLDV